MTPKSFEGLTITYETMMKKVRALPLTDIPYFRDKALYRFVADLLRWFETYPTLDVVRVEHNCATEDRAQTPALLETSHRIRLYAKAAGIDRDVDATAHDMYVSEMLPFTIWGAGLFEIRRDDERIQRYLAMGENEALKWQALVAEIALQMDSCFGEVRMVHAIEN